MSKKNLPRYGCETEETHYVLVCKRCKIWSNLLDKEYADHTREVADLKQQLGELEIGYGQEQKRLSDGMDKWQQIAEKFHDDKANLQTELNIQSKEVANLKKMIEFLKSELLHDVEDYEKLVSDANTRTANLQHQLEVAYAERDVWSGLACKEEMETGTGPCGACQYCLPTIVKDLRTENDNLQQRVAELEQLKEHWETYYAIFGNRDLESQVIDLKQHIKELENKYICPLCGNSAEFFKDVSKSQPNKKRSFMISCTCSDPGIYSMVEVDKKE